MLIEDVTTND